jgi:hypothetical protein
LRAEFEAIDSNHDREVTREEICNYLIARVPESTSTENRAELLERFDVIVNVLFEQMDQGMNGFVDLDSFVSHYHSE